MAAKDDLKGVPQRLPLNNRSEITLGEGALPHAGSLAGFALVPLVLAGGAPGNEIQSG